MPEEYRAESAIVQPKPASFAAIDAVLNNMARSCDITSMLMGHSAGANYIGGLQGGLAIAIDHPEVVRTLLAAIDAGKREDAVAHNFPDPDADVATDAQARALYMKPLVEAALGHSVEAATQPDKQDEPPAIPDVFVNWDN